MSYYSSLLGSQSHSRAWLHSPVTHNACLFPGWRCYLLPLSRLATERIKPSQQLPGCSERCSGLIPPMAEKSCEHKPCQTHQVSPDPPGDHESPLSLRLMVVMGWAAAPEGISATATDHKEGECTRLFSSALIVTGVSNKFTQSSSINKFLGPPN